MSLSTGCHHQVELVQSTLGELIHSVQLFFSYLSLFSHAFVWMFAIFWANLSTMPLLEGLLQCSSVLCVMMWYVAEVGNPSGNPGGNGSAAGKIENYTCCTQVSMHQCIC